MRFKVHRQTHYILLIVGSGLKTYTIITLFILTLVACSQAPPPSPACRVHIDYRDTHQGHGACLVRIQDGLLTVKYKQSESIDLPSGNFISPETSQCSAHRHIWEQTGFNVKVAQLLGVTGEGLRIYACHLGGGFDGTETDIDTPHWTSRDVEEVGFVDPFDTRYDVWQHPKNLILIRDAYVAQGYTEIMSDEDINQMSYKSERF